MRIATFILLILSVFLFLKNTKSQITKETSVFVIDPNTSYVEWNCDSHHGIVPVKNGIIKLSAGEIISGKFTMLMDSIKDLDIEYPLMKKTLENTLRSEFFFDVKNYPEAMFEIDHSFNRENNKYLIVGDMWITGLVNCIEFTSTINYNNQELTAISDTFKINRINWNLTIYSKQEAKSEESVIVSDSISFVVHLKGKTESKR